LDVENSKKPAYHTVTCKFPITSLQCQHIMTLYWYDRKFTCKKMIHWFLLFSTLLKPLDGMRCHLAWVWQTDGQTYGPRYRIMSQTGVIITLSDAA